VFRLTTLQQKLGTWLSRIPGTAQHVGSAVSGISGVQKQHNFIIFMTQYNQFVKQFQVGLNMELFRALSN
jgi:hypothetical protein